MWDSPCRRFMYGLTIEDDQAKIWHFSRSAVTVTDPLKYLSVRHCRLSRSTSVESDGSVGRH